MTYSNKLHDFYSDELRFTRDESFREACLRLMKKQSISQRDVASEAEKTAGWLNRILRGEGHIRPETRVAVAVAIHKCIARTTPDEPEDRLQKRIAIILGATDGARTEELKEEAERAQEHFILTFRPAETVKQSQIASELKLAMVTRLGLLAPWPDRVSTIIKYKFYVPNQLIARLLWLGLHEFLRDELHISDASERLFKANSSEVTDPPHGQLYVKEVPSRFCVYPTVVYDPATTDPRGFVIYYHEDEVDVARMSPDAITIWMKEIYDPLVGDPQGNGVKEVRWADVAPEGA